jgi:hypothetical protein
VIYPLSADMVHLYENYFREIYSNYYHLFGCFICYSRFFILFLQWLCYVHSLHVPHWCQTYVILFDVINSMRTMALTFLWVLWVDVAFYVFQNDIPVFCPGLTDGSLGDMLYFHSFHNPGLIVDIVQGSCLLLQCYFFHDKYNLRCQPYNRYFLNRY